MPTRLRFPHEFAELDPSVRREIVDHAAADGLPLTGVLYLPARRDPDVVVLAMHPRVDFSRHYLAPKLVADPRDRVVDELIFPWLRAHWPG